MMAGVALSISVQVPIDDSACLRELGEQLDQPAEVTDLHPFDGEVMSEAVFVVTAVGIPLIKAWLNTQVAKRQRFRVVHDGTEYEGYTREEVEQLVQALRADADG
jgi:signal transduction protein with GAF and PtsI domain